MGRQLILLWAVACLAAVARDPLPSWREGAAKRAIVSAVDRMTTPASAEFVPEASRVAAFDDDGTLWPERPSVQGAFIVDKVTRLAATFPDVPKKDFYRKILDGGVAQFDHVAPHDLLATIGVIYAGTRASAFDDEVREFLWRARHPRYHRRYSELGYRPMAEVIALLREKNFRVYLCATGLGDFLREAARTMYGIGPEQIVASVAKKRLVDGNLVWTPAFFETNDRASKPVNFEWRVGQPPAFAAGNVGTGGDIELLTYSGARAGGSFQMVVYHDDRARESEYFEKDGATLLSARAKGWLVVSVKNDWREIF